MISTSFSIFGQVSGTNLPAGHTISREDGGEADTRSPDAVLRSPFFFSSIANYMTLFYFSEEMKRMFSEKVALPIRCCSPAALDLISANRAGR